ncbi:hypothetical protein RJ639_005681 [Escallonia herrerae]|uniref:Uncharacterized protein n=1 Tax=Escallonia herrerae TaxID=1293975 RepID=A0AA88VV35_9ASTE|nr:hypothetical protein RJ639_005681 [Escallonia herrerae]
MIKRPNYVHNADSISGSSPEPRTRVGEYRDQHVLLHIERPRIQRKLPRTEPRQAKRSRRQHLRHEPADWERGDLYSYHRNDERFGPVREERVEEGQDGARNEAEKPHPKRPFRIKGTSFKVIVEKEEKVELSFTRIWDPSVQGEQAPLYIDKRFVVLRGNSGFYSYAIFEHSKDMPVFNLTTTGIAFMLRKDKSKLKGKGTCLTYTTACPKEANNWTTLRQSYLSIQ